MDSSSCNYGSSTEISIDLEKPYVDTKIYNIALLVEAKRQLEAQIQTVDEKLLASLRHRRQLTITTESSNSFGFRAGEGAVLPTSGSRKGKEKIEYRPESNIDNKNKKLKRFPNNSDENHPQEAAEIKKARVTMMLDLTKDPNNRGPSQAAAVQPNAQSSVANDLPPSVLNTLIKNVMVNPDFTAAIHAAIVNTLIKNVMVNPDFTAAIHAAIAAAINGSAGPGPSNQQQANVSNSTSSN